MHEPVDFIALMIALLGMLTSQQVAAIAGPYAAIMVLAASGAAVSFSLSDGQFSILQGVWYVSLRVLLAVVLTVSVAEFLTSFVDWLKPRYTIAPLAFAIGCIRDFKKAFEWSKDTIKTLWNLRNGKPNNP